MKWPDRRQFIRLIVFIAAIAITATMIWYGTPRPAAVSSGEGAVSTSSNAAPPTTGLAAGSPTTSASASAVDSTTAPQSALSAGSALDQQVKRFAEAYYLILPADTSAIRRARVQALGLVAAQALPMLDFSLQPNEVEYQQLGITQRPTVDPRTMAANPVSDGAANQQQVSLPVTLAWTDNSGKPIGATDIATVSQWSFDGTRWTMTNFSPEGGG